MAKKKKEAKTNAARILDTLGISYELKTYEVDESDLSAQHIVDQLGEDIHRVIVSVLTFLLVGHHLPVELREALLPAERHINMILKESKMEHHLL